MPIPAKQMSWGDVNHTQLLPLHPYHYYHHVSNGKSNVHVKKDRGGTESTIMSSGFMQSDKWQPSVVTKEEGKKQAMEEMPQDISSTKQKEANRSWMAQVLITMTKTIKLEQRQKLIKVIRD